MSEMMHLQSNFTLGEIDPRLFGRVDLGILQKGLKRARNVVVIPQGGLRRRFGTEYIVNASITTSKTEIRIAVFEYTDSTKYLLVFEHLSLKIYHDDVLVSTKVSPYSAAQLPNIKFTQSSNEFITVHPDTPQYALERVTAHTVWTYAPIVFTYMPTTDFNHDYDAITFTPNAVAATQITASSAIFTTAHAGGLVIGNEGTFRIVTVSSTTVVAGFAVTDFKDTSGISGKLVELTEPVWSAEYGYPRCTTFFQNRLGFGGSRGTPNGVWLSKTNDFADFDDSEALATSSIGAYITTNNSNIIEDMLGEKTLLVFTSAGLISTQNQADTPLTPINGAFTLQNNNGIGNVSSLIFDNKIVYIDRGGKMVWGVNYDVQRGGQVSTDLSLLSQTLIDNPQCAVAYRSPQTDNGNYLCLINEDGSMAVLQAVDAQNVLGWSLCTTDGYFRHAAVSHDLMYLVIERVIDGNTVFYIEKLRFDLTLDSTYIHTYGSPTTAISGLDHLEDETVKILGDTKLQKDKVVTGGAITLDTAATDVEIGLNYIPSVIPLPISVVTQSGSDLYLAKRIKTFWIDYYEALGLYVDGELIPFLTLDESKFDVAPDLKTDFSLITPMHGWDPRAEIEITQDEPYSMTLIGVGFEIELTGGG